MTTNNLTEHIEILTKHNHWRRCNDEGCGCSAVDVKKIGLAIDAAIEVMQVSAESEPVAWLGYSPQPNGTYKSVLSEDRHVRGVAWQIGLYTSPHTSDAEAKLKVLVDFLKPLADNISTTYDYSGNELNNIARQALEKIGE